jgi:deoxyribodipyrimidine photo-lyase
MPPDAQEKAGCRIGRDYPAPIVEHAQARRDALDRYRV